MFKMICILVVIMLFAAMPSFGFSPVCAALLSDCCDGGDCCIYNDCTCPNCEGRGEPGGVCERCNYALCKNCGNCYSCGISPCPICRADDLGDEFTPYITSDPPHDGGSEITSSVSESVSAMTLVNFLLAFFGFIATVAVIIRTKVLKRKSDAKTYKRYASRYRFFAVILIILCASGISLFFYTQNISRFFVLFDKWTIIHALLFFGIAVFGYLLDRRIEEYEYTVTQTVEVA